MFTMIITGALGADAKLNQVNGTNGSTPVLNFSVAVKSKKKDAQGKPITKWVDCALWGKRAESMAQYMTKGTVVSLNGEPDMDSYNGQNGLVLKQTLTVDDIQMFGGKSQNQNAAPQQNMTQTGHGAQAAPMGQQSPQQMGNPQYQQNPAMANANAGFGGQDDDVPFSNYELRVLA